MPHVFLEGAPVVQSGVVDDEAVFGTHGSDPSGVESRPPPHLLHKNGNFYTNGNLAQDFLTFLTNSSHCLVSKSSAFATAVLFMVTFLLKLDRMASAGSLMMIKALSKEFLGNNPWVFTATTDPLVSLLALLEEDGK